MGFLKCKSCGECYQLKPGELLDDFESCTCGGELEFYDSSGEKTSDYGPISRSKGLIKKLVLFLVAFYVVDMILGRVFAGIIYNLGWVGPNIGSLLLLLFIGTGIVVVIILLGFMWRKKK
jgi:hypothetical protein